jgi:hypothetical protein
MTWHVCMPTKQLKGVEMACGGAHCALSNSRPELRAFVVDVIDGKR